MDSRVNHCFYRLRRFRSFIAALGIYFAGGGTTIVVADDSLDALAPTSSAESALTGPLHTITVSTNSLEESLLYYREGLGLKVEGPLPQSRADLAEQRRRWGVSASIDWEVYRLFRDGVPGAAQIRLLVIDTPVAAIHNSWSALELGTFSMGFPNLDQTALDKQMRQLGFGALNEIERYEVPRTDGSKYPIEETIFNGPDFVHGVGIHRGDGMSQLGPIQQASGMGGPAYSAAVVADSDAMLGFLVGVLGLELRSDRVWESAGSKGALNVPDGTIFRFSIVYSPGSRSQHLLLVDYQNIDAIDSGVAPRVPNRGIGMWTFEVKDIDELMQRARMANSPVIAEVSCVESRMLGEVRTATLQAPNGLLVELFESSTDCAASDSLAEEVVLPFTIGGWTELVLSVSSIEDVQADFLQVGGWEVLASASSSADQLAAWGLPAGASARERLLGNPGTTSGFLRLVQFSGVQQEQIRSSAQSWDTGGIFDFNVRVTDLSERRTALLHRGWQAAADPQRFEFGPFEVTEWITRGPDGIAMAMIERHEPPLEGWPALRRFSRTFNATQVVRDMPAALAFYRDTLGFGSYLHHVGASAGSGENVLGLPLSVAREVPREVWILHPEAQNEGSVELLGFEGMEGRDLAERAVPPNLGILIKRFPVSDVDALAAHLVDRGYPLEYAPRALPMSPAGARRMLAVRSPEGAWLEFYEDPDVQTRGR